MSGRKPEIEGLPDRLTAADIIGMDEETFMDRMQRTGMAAQVDAAMERDRGHGTGADGGGLMTVFRCSQCPYQMWDPSPEDIDDHWRTEHGDGVIRVTHDHGPGPDLKCADCRAALDEYDRYAELAPIDTTRNSKTSDD